LRTDLRPSHFVALHGVQFPPIKYFRLLKAGHNGTPEASTNYRIHWQHGAAWPLGARAQQEPSKIHRIGVLWHGANAEQEAIYLAALRQGLNDYG
jgi:hypothetical protein